VSWRCLFKVVVAVVVESLASFTTISSLSGVSGMATSMSSSQPSGAHGLFWSLLFAVLLLGILTERLLVFLHSCRSSPPPLSAQQERMLKCHAVADVAKAQKEASLLLPVSSPSASTSTSGGQKQKSGKGGQAWLLLFVGAACTLSAAAVALLATAVTGALFYAWNEEHVADCTWLCPLLSPRDDALTAPARSAPGNPSLHHPHHA
jgi:hypothetical protein